ncbi:MAG: signal peptidase I [Chloroflexota bacterium]
MISDSDNKEPKAVKRWFERFGNILGFALTFVIMLATAAVYFGPHFGLRIDNVLSDSMSPELERGTLAVSVPVNPGTIRKGDIIVFNPIPAAERPMVHRVVEVRNSPLQFVTQGDALTRPDPLTVPARNLLGKVIYHAPLLGFVAYFLKTLPGLLLCLVLPGVVIFWLCLEGIRSELPRKKTG